LTAKSLADGLVKISVSDSGVGISDEIKRKLFLVKYKAPMGQMEKRVLGWVLC
jgi:hypothetical protein